MPFPPNYQQKKLSHFDGTGSPTEHIAHFLSQCGDTAQSGPLLMIRPNSSKTSLGIASSHPEKSRIGINQMERAFLQRFYSTQKSVGITELTQTTQRNSEAAADFITRWRNLSLHCPQSISEREAIRMCMNNLKRDSPSYASKSNPKPSRTYPPGRQIYRILSLVIRREIDPRGRSLNPTIRPSSPWLVVQMGKGKAPKEAEKPKGRGR